MPSPETSGERYARKHTIDPNSERRIYVNKDLRKNPHFFFITPERCLRRLLILI